MTCPRPKRLVVFVITFQNGDVSINEARTSRHWYYPVKAEMCRIPDAMRPIRGELLDDDAIPLYTKTHWMQEYLNAGARVIQRGLAP